jgi:hypothetical protein
MDNEILPWPELNSATKDNLIPLSLLLQQHFQPGLAILREQVSFRLHRRLRTTLQLVASLSYPTY